MFFFVLGIPFYFMCCLNKLICKQNVFNDHTQTVKCSNFNFFKHGILIDVLVYICKIATNIHIVRIVKLLCVCVCAVKTVYNIFWRNTSTQIHTHLDLCKRLYIVIQWFLLHRSPGVYLTLLLMFLLQCGWAGLVIHLLTQNVKTYK